MSLVSLSRAPAVSDATQYRLLSATVFPFFLAAAALSRIGRAQSGVGRSLLADARAASANALLYAFQG